MASDLRSRYRKQRRAARWATALIVSCYGFTVSPAVAQQYPAKPIRIVVPLSAGAADTLSRVIGANLAEAWGQPVVIENRPGAGTTLGSDVVAKATPDGHTLLMATFSHAINPTFYRKLPYDTLKSFAPITAVASAPNVLAVHPSVPAQTVQELIALAKAQPGKLNFASAGNGSSSHLAGELFKAITAVDIVHIPYKGAAPALADLLGGHVQMAWDPLPSSIANIKSTKLRAIAMSTLKRSPALPEVPTLAESGVTGYELNGWSGLVAPAATSRDTLRRLNAEIVRIINTPDVRNRFASLGFDTIGNTSEQFDAFIRTEIIKWGKVIRDANIYAD
jgi:tripartite-type tricarboxylate transporter receptor subunit TctC